jgi:ribose transport system substrate-binding protein
LAALCAVLALGLTAGCGSSGSGGASGATASTAASTTPSGGNDIVAQAKAAITKASAQVTSGVPASSPKPAKNKSVVLIPCAAAAEGCSQPMDGAAAAAKVLGWKSRTIDGKGTPADEAAAIEQAITLKPDAIILHAIDPETVKGAIKNAKSAGIAVIASSVPESNLVDFSKSPTEDSWVHSGALQADFIIAQSDGKAKYIQLTNPEFGVVKLRTQGFEQEIAKCSGCKKVASASYTFADMASKLPQLTQQLLQSNPTADTIVVPYDAAAPFVLQGMKAVGKKLTVVAGDGTTEGLKCIRTDCGLTGTPALPVTWIGWTDIDAANRIFNKQDPSAASTGLPTKFMTKDNVPSQNGPWQGDIDFPSAYAKLWGVAGG